MPLLRSIIHEDRWLGRFMLLGAAAPSLIRKTAESLAGRVAYLALSFLSFSLCSRNISSTSGYFATISFSKISIPVRTLLNFFV